MYDAVEFCILQQAQQGLKISHYLDSSLFHTPVIGHELLVLRGPTLYLDKLMAYLKKVNVTVLKEVTPHKPGILTCDFPFDICKSEWHFITTKEVF